METVHQAFTAAALDAPRQPFLMRPQGPELTYGRMLEDVRAQKALYQAAGWGAGHRVALRLGNSFDFVRHFLALNGLGVGVVPINPDLKDSELAYLLAHSEAALAVGFQTELDVLAHAPARMATEAQPPSAPDRKAAEAGEGALLYTSGTTGHPKGCRLMDSYFLEAGRWYLRQGGLCLIRPGRERMLTPLPLFHMNALAFSLMAMILSGGGLVLLERFRASTWWDAVYESGASIVHYLGVMPAILLARPFEERERRHQVRFGFGAGVDPAHHAAFEARFGFPLIEGWSMTETGPGGCIAATTEPRHVGQRCFGHPSAQRLDYRLVNDEGGDAPEGELLVRAPGPDPRAGFFAGYLKDPAATDKAWEGGWFHTGDVVRRLADDSLAFVERKKNVIRRSGENIAALEVEGVLRRSALVAEVAVLAAPDPIRGEEVLACVVPAPEVAANLINARALQRHCLEALAYFKAPGWVIFLDQLPTTSTLKVRKADLAALGLDPASHPGAFDLRAGKKREAAQ